jgi:signal peptidase II
MSEPLHKQTNARPKNGRVFLSRLYSPDARRITLKPTADIPAHLIFWLVSVAGLTLDLWTKSAAFKYLQSGHINGIPVINGFLQIVRTENTGAAFGIASGMYRLLTAVSFAALIIVLLIFLFGRAKCSSFYLAMGFLAAGISGNLYDRIFNNGRVRDFIDVVYWPGRHWPAFNVADSLLCIAVGIILLLSFTGKLYQKHGQQQK